MSNIVYIYKWTNFHNAKAYIGSTVHLGKRMNHHKSVCKWIVSPFYSAIKRYGWNSFIFQILEECSKDDRNERESYWINHFQTLNRDFGYNLLMADYTEASDEHKEKHKKSCLRGENHPFFGTHRSKEVCNKIAEKHRNLPPVSQETRDKIRVKSTGKKPRLGMKNKPESTRKNIESHMGEKNCRFGITHTPEAREKIAYAASHISEETRQKQRNARLGTKDTQETKDKKSMASKLVQQRKREEKAKINRDKVQKLF